MTGRDALVAAGSALAVFLLRNTLAVTSPGAVSGLGLAQSAAAPSLLSGGSSRRWPACGRSPTSPPSRRSGKRWLRPRCWRVIGRRGDGPGARPGAVGDERDEPADGGWASAPPWPWRLPGRGLRHGRRASATAWCSSSAGCCRAGRQAARAGRVWAGWRWSSPACWPRAGRPGDGLELRGRQARCRGRLAGGAGDDGAVGAGRTCACTRRCPTGHVPPSSPST